MHAYRSKTKFIGAKQRATEELLYFHQNWSFSFHNRHRSGFEFYILILVCRHIQLNLFSEILFRSIQTISFLFILWSTKNKFLLYWFNGWTISDILSCVCSIPIHLFGDSFCLSSSFIFSSIWSFDYSEWNMGQSRNGYDKRACLSHS